MENDFATILALTIYMFVSLRWIFWGITDYQLNKKERKKKKNGQTFKEWLFYSRYRNELPKFLIYLYFAITISHIVIFIIVVILFFFHLSFFYNIIDLSINIIIWLDVIVIFAFNFAFRGRKNGKTFLNVGRWFKKGKKK